MYKFRIRCSAISKIMGSTNRLTQGNVTYLENWLKGKIYGRQPHITSKYCEKGTLVEDQAIEFIGQYLGLPLSKNTERKHNDFLEGECDVDTGDTIIDNKSSWDCFTFPLTDAKPPKKEYVLQLQGYMELWGRDKAKLVYTLMNTPEKIVEKEASFEARNSGENYEDVLEDLLKYHNYNETKIHHRYKEFNIEKDEDVIAKIKQRVKMCQVYIDSLVKKLKIGEF
jgi:hypothetical protein